MSTVTLINPFEVPRGQEIAFLEHWKRASDYLSQQRGFISTQLQKSVSRRTRFRYTNVAVWKSRQHFLQAVKTEEFQLILSEVDLTHFSSLFDLLLDDVDPLAETLARREPRRGQPPETRFH